MDTVCREDLYEALTERELTILNLIAQGCSDHEIADALSLSRNTVKWYARRMFDKLHVKRRMQAVATAQSLGLLSLPDAPNLLLPSTSYATTPIIGRAQELADLTTLLNDPTVRLITLLGPGGIGKTRLAQAASEEWRSLKPTMPVHFLLLENLASCEHLIPALLTAVGGHAATNGDSMQPLMQSLHRKPVLLILDGFEHVIEASGLINQILGASENVKILITSRQSLGLRAETRFPLRGLALETDYQRCSACHLFVQVARRVQYTFVPNEQERQEIEHICRLVEGLPLAIEITASWLETLTLAEIANEIACGHDLQAYGRDFPERHRSLDSIFEHSWRLLSSVEKLAFAKLSVFRGVFDRSAAQAVAGVSAFDLSTLVDKSIVMRSGIDQYRMHQLARQFAERMLQLEPDTYQQALYDHCRYYGDLMERVEHEAKTNPASVPKLVSQMQAGSENLMAGWHRAVEIPFVDQISRYVYSLSLLFLPARLYAFSEPLFAEALQVVESRAEQVRTTDRVRVLTLYAWFAFAWSKPDAAFNAISRAVDLSQLLDDPFAQDTALLFTLAGWINFLKGETATSRAYFIHAVERCRQVNFLLGLWLSLTHLDELEYVSGNYEASERYFNEMIELVQRPQLLSNVLFMLGAHATDVQLLRQETLEEKFRQSFEATPAPLFIDALFAALLSLAMGHHCGGNYKTALEILAICLYHPRASQMAKNRIAHAMPRFRSVMTPAQMNKIIHAAREGNLSNQLVAANFEFSPQLIDRLLNEANSIIGYDTSR